MKNKPHTIASLAELAKNKPEVASNYALGFKDRMDKREAEFKNTAKSQKWTKANDDFEYTI